MGKYKAEQSCSYCCETQKKILTLLFVIMLQIWLPSRLFSATADNQIEVLGIEGSPLVLEPFSSRWRSIELTERLVSDSLIQIRPGERVRMSIRLERKIEIDELEIDFPILFRVNSENIRNLVLNKYKVEDFSDLLKKGQKKGEDNQLFNLSSAEFWNIFDETVENAEDYGAAFKIQFRDYLGKNGDISNIEGSLGILRPLPGEKIEIKDYPAKVDVDLSDRFKNYPYQIYAWKQEKGKELPSNPLTETYHRNASLQVFESGSYFMVIVDSKGRISGTSSFSISHNKVRSNSNTFLSTIKALKSPTDGSRYLILHPRKRAQVLFDFRMSASSDATRLNIVVRSSNNEKFKRRMNVGSVTAIQLGDGSYTWWLEAADNSFRSPSYTFEVIAQINRKNIFKHLSLGSIDFRHFTVQ